MEKIKKISIILILLHSFVNIISSSQEKYFIDATSLNVRKNANINSEIIGRLNKNQEIKLIEKTEIISKIDDNYAFWIKIKFSNDSIGYVFGGYVIRKFILGNGASDERKVFLIDLIPSITEIMIIDSNANVFECPSYNSAIISKIIIGDTLKSIKFAYTENSIKEKYYWYYIKTLTIEGFINSRNIMTKIVEKDSKFYGINKFPIEMIAPEEQRFIQNNSEILVFSKKENSVIQRFIMPDSTDYIEIANENRFNKIFGDRIIVIEHYWNHFTCCPIGYQCNTIYSLDNDGRISKKVFSWFKDIGAQDEPSATIQDMKINLDNIVLDYKYFDNSGFPGLGNGLLKIYYKVNNGSIYFDKIESLVKQNSQIIDGSYSDDEKHNLKQPKIIKFTKDELNSKFLYLSKVYPFIY
jgi:hypothetical protein